MKCEKSTSVENIIDWEKTKNCVDNSQIRWGLLKPAQIRTYVHKHARTCAQSQSRTHRHFQVVLHNEFDTCHHHQYIGLWESIRRQYNSRLCFMVRCDECRHAKLMYNITRLLRIWKHSTLALIQKLIQLLQFSNRRLYKPCKRISKFATHYNQSCQKPWHGFTINLPCNLPQNIIIANTLSSINGRKNYISQSTKSYPCEIKKKVKKV